MPPPLIHAAKRCPERPHKRPGALRAADGALAARIRRNSARARVRAVRVCTLRLSAPVDLRAGKVTLPEGWTPPPGHPGFIWPDGTGPHPEPPARHPNGPHGSSSSSSADAGSGFQSWIAP